MILATTKVEDVDRFLEVFGTKGADKRALHGSKGSTVFRDPTEANRVWALFDWDEQGWAAFVSDPEVPPILKEAGHLGKPESAALLGQYRRRGDDDKHHRSSGSASASSPTRPARCPSWASPTSTSPGWSSTTSTRRAVCSAVPSSCSSRTAPPTTTWRRPRRRGSSTPTSTSSWAASTARPGRPSRCPWSTRPGSSTCIPEQYEGQECHPLIFCTGPVPAQQVEPFFPWLMEETGAKTFYLPSADYIWPHTLNKKVREVVDRPRRRDRRRAVLPARSHRLRRRGGRHHGVGRRRRVQHDRAARSHAVPRPAVRGRVHGARGGRWCARTSTRTS